MLSVVPWGVIQGNYGIFMFLVLFLGELFKELWYIHVSVLFPGELFMELWYIHVSLLLL